MQIAQIANEYNAVDRIIKMCKEVLNYYDVLQKDGTIGTVSISDIAHIADIADVSKNDPGSVWPVRGDGRESSLAERDSVADSVTTSGMPIYVSREEYWQYCMLTYIVTQYAMFDLITNPPYWSVEYDMPTFLSSVCLSSLVLWYNCDVQQLPTYTCMYCVVHPFSETRNISEYLGRVKKLPVLGTQKWRFFTTRRNVSNVSLELRGSKTDVQDRLHPCHFGQKHSHFAEFGRWELKEQPKDRISDPKTFHWISHDFTGSNSMENRFRGDFELFIGISTEGKTRNSNFEFPWIVVFSVIYGISNEIFRILFSSFSLFRYFFALFEQGVMPVPGIIRAGMPKDDSDALEALGFSKVGWKTRKT